MRWRSLGLWLWLLALPLAFGLSVDRQGLDLVEDGSWLLGAARLSQLHDSLRVADAPGRFLLLRGCFALLGQSARSLDLLQALLACLLSLLLYVRLRQSGLRAVAALSPVLVAALGPVTLAPLFLLALSLSLRWPALRMAGLFALCPLFGLQFALLGLVLVGLDHSSPRRWRPAVFGVGSGVLALLIAGLIFGRPGIAFDALVDPTRRWLAALGDGSAWQWWESWRHGAYPRTPFAGLHSGERLQPLFLGHGALRWIGFAALYGSAMLAPLVLLVGWRVRRAQRTLLALAAVASALLWARGDVPQLRAAALSGACLWLLALASPGRRGLPLRLLFCLPLLVPVLERGVLSLRHYRSSLVLWDEPSAAVLLAPARAQRLEALVHDLRHGSGPLFVWPSAPGLHFLSRRPLATPSMLPVSGLDALGGEIAASQPSSVLLAPGAIVGRRALSRSEPSLIETLRLHYRWLGSTVGSSDEYRALERLPPGESIESLPLVDRLPFAEMTVGNDLSPALHPGFSIGQSLRTGSTDLQGFSMRWSSPGGEQTVRLRIWLWMLQGSERPVLLHFFDTAVQVAGDGHRSYLRFGPVAQTSAMNLALTLEVREEPAHELRLWMHRHDEGGARADFYPLGSALFHEEPVAADLVFAAY